MHLVQSEAGTVEAHLANLLPLLELQPVISRTNSSPERELDCLEVSEELSESAARIVNRRVTASSKECTHSVPMTNCTIVS